MSYILMFFIKFYTLYIKSTKYSTYIPLCISIIYLLRITIQNIHYPEADRITQMWSA